MKFFIGDGVEIELAPEIEKHVIVMNDTTFQYNQKMYSVRPVEFRLDEVYFLLHDIIKKNPGKKIFIHHFEQLANNYYAMYHAVEE